MINDEQFVKDLDSPCLEQGKNKWTVVMIEYSFHGTRRILQLVDSEFIRIFSYKK